MFVRNAVLALALCAMPLAASGQEAATPFPEFEAKRVKPPAPGTGKRITVQIEPEPEAESSPSCSACCRGPGRCAARGTLRLVLGQGRVGD